jgi:hypothetical protein
MRIKPMFTLPSRLLAAACVTCVLGLGGGAEAACQKLAFSVNDYGKTGPAADAQKLLDKFIAEWTRGKGIRKYTTGKKTVDCKLYLDVGFFDEYTCRAVANVCWDGKPRTARDRTAATRRK